MNIYYEYNHLLFSRMANLAMVQYWKERFLVSILVYSILCLFWKAELLKLLIKTARYRLAQVKLGSRIPRHRQLEMPLDPWKDIFGMHAQLWGSTMGTFLMTWVCVQQESTWSIQNMQLMILISMHFWLCHVIMFELNTPANTFRAIRRRNTYLVVGWTTPQQHNNIWRDH